MIELEVERDIAKPVDDVFARLADIDHYRDWLPKSLIFKGGGLVVPDEDVGLGTEFVDVTPIGRLQGSVTSFEPPTGIAFQQTLRRLGKALFISRPAYQLTSTDDGTHLRHRGEAEVFGPLTFTEPVVRRLAVQERTRVVDALQRSFEST